MGVLELMGVGSSSRYDASASTGSRGVLRTSGFLPLGRTAACQVDSDDVAVKYHGIADETLDVEQNLAAMELHSLADKYEAIARLHHSTEAHLLHPSEPNEIPGQESRPNGVVRDKLGCRFANEYPR